MEPFKRICERHGEYEAVILPWEGAESACPYCARERQKEARDEYDREIREHEMLRRKESLAERGIEPEFMGATLDNYKAENQTEAQALEACRSIKDGRISKVFLLGDHGTGKTHLACALIKELGGIRTTMFELSCRIRKGYGQNMNEIDVLDGLLEYPFIVIDEVGRAKGSEAEMNWLSYLIDKAHVRGIRICLISNRHLSKSLPPDRKGESVEEFLPNDAISRLRQSCMIVEVKGRDRRAA